MKECSWCGKIVKENVKECYWCHHKVEIKEYRRNKQRKTYSTISALDNQVKKDDNSKINKISGEFDWAETIPVLGTIIALSAVIFNIWYLKNSFASSLLVFFLFSYFFIDRLYVRNSFEAILAFISDACLAVYCVYAFYWVLDKARGNIGGFWITVIGVIIGFITFGFSATHIDDDGVLGLISRISIAVCAIAVFLPLAYLGLWLFGVIFTKVLLTIVYVVCAIITVFLYNESVF